MKILVVEDDRKIKTEIIDDTLTSLGYESDWATNQQEANGLLVANDYELMLLDLQIPSRPTGRPSSEYGKHLLGQAHERKGPGNMAVILMTGYHQQCVDMATDLHETGVDACISKPFPDTGRTLAVVIKEVMEKVRRRRVVAGSDGQPRQLQPFAGGVLGFHQRHIDLCGETIVGKNQKGYAWRILHLLRQKNERGRYIRMNSGALVAKLDRDLMQNTLSQSIKALRDRISEVLHERLDLDCGQMDVIDNRGKGYHLRDWIVVEDCDEASAAGGTSPASEGKAGGDVADCGRFSERQRWVLAQLAGEVRLTRRDVEKQFGISTRTAKRELGELVAAGMIQYDRSESPGCYRLTS